MAGQYVEIRGELQVMVGGKFETVCLKHFYGPNDDSDWAKEYVEALAAKGIVSYPDQTSLRPLTHEEYQQRYSSIKSVDLNVRPPRNAMVACRRCVLNKCWSG